MCDSNTFVYVAYLFLLYVIKRREYLTVCRLYFRFRYIYYFNFFYSIFFYLRKNYVWLWPSKWKMNEKNAGTKNWSRMIWIKFVYISRYNAIQQQRSIQKKQKKMQNKSNEILNLNWLNFLWVHSHLRPSNKLKSMQRLMEFQMCCKSTIFSLFLTPM